MFFSTPPTTKPDLKELREKQAMARAQLTRQNHGFIPESAYHQRKAFFVAKVTSLTPAIFLRSLSPSLTFLVFSLHVSFHTQETGMFSKKPEAKSAQEQMMSNPDMMSDMMKKNLGGIVPQVSFSLFQPRWKFFAFYPYIAGSGDLLAVTCRSRWEHS